MKNKILQCIIALILCFAAAFGVEFYCQRNVLGLSNKYDATISANITPEEEMADPYYTDSAAYADPDYADNSADEEGDYASEEEDFSPELPAEMHDAAAFYRNHDLTWAIYPSGYVEKMTVNFSTDDPYYNGSFPVNVRVNYLDGSSRSFTCFSYGEDRIHFDVKGFAPSIDISLGDMAEDTVITSFTIKNTFHLNFSRMLTTLLLSLAFSAIVIFRKKLGDNPEIAFIAIALAFTVVTAVNLPTATRLSYDDQIHLQRIITMSHPFGEKVITADENFAVGLNVYGTDIHGCDSKADFAQLLKDKGTARVDYMDYRFAFSDIGYLTQAAAYGISDLMGASLPLRIILTRLANALTYVIICIFAIRSLKNAPSLKIPLMLLLTMPMPMYLASSISYDPTAIALCALGTASAINAIYTKGKVLRPGEVLKITIPLLLGSMTKGVYFPLLIIPLMIPKERFSGKLQRVGFKALCSAMAIWGVISMLMAVDAGSITLQDIRVDASSVEQIRFILTHPLQYMKILGNFAITQLIPLIETQSRVSLGYSGVVNYNASIIHLILLICAVIMSNNGELRVKLSHKAVYAAIFALSTIIIVTALYVSFTPLMKPTIDGVQGRYFIPLLMCLVMIFCPNHVENKIQPHRYACAVSVVDFIIMFSAVMQLQGLYWG